ncbi:aromatic amino acid beta-eliminating lyase/threonine aldolase [Planococcus antarcticus DSM 14505]|uniref:Aromatic amino acid beta-eliminating lyase/threonine aldolase n=1 Tax=Planococcus antarcticus DSM 14505 TaxID=1185653 RepID=A0AA87IMJ0_9BACL|nr:beta-eliminating lyase-related protein [Planococcus antarcticus]EIM06218.1 aromatic amino acid beta-eliminating lyase/threonine aldolase [Planococcus antarcticus DSM 14505]
MTQKMFASDKNSGVHPLILEAMGQANDGHVPAYGNDPYTAAAIQKFKEHFGEECEVVFVFNGTGANVTGLKAMVRSHQAIICTDGAHINSDEGGAPEGFIGGKLLTSPSAVGKLTISQIERQLHHIGNPQRSQPKAISISQCTELGTVYTIDEIKEITSYAHENGLYVHMDGVRLSNAAAYLDCSFAEMTVDAGIDMLAFGGTKNGLMIGEAVVCFNPELAPEITYIRKQGMQLGSKMRFLSVQFDRLLTENLWLDNARSANHSAQLLAEGLSAFPEITLSQPVQSNAIVWVPGTQTIPD